MAAQAEKKNSNIKGYSGILLNPRITEKASMKAMNENVYMFDVLPSATKTDIKRAIIEIYDVTPTKVATSAIPRKQVFIRGRRGMKSGGKKAFVYLKKGDKIEFV